MAHFCFGRHNKIQTDDELEEFFANTITNARKFTYLSLKIATNNFSQDRFIGRGCYGSVYRGVMPNGTLVAVKVMHNSFGIHELLSMVKGIFCLSNSNSMKHPNIDQAIGYSVNKGHLLLVSEYADNGNLHTLLSPEKKESIFLNWHKRVAICIGIARGLAFLHEEANPHVIHRDIKTRNILLDNNFVPKITGFNVAAFFSESNDLPLEEHVGTIGYIDPGYLATSEFTEKADVYSFGVVLLEIISGRMAFFVGSDGEPYLVAKWASELVENDSGLEIIDPLLTDFPTDGARHFIDVALSCINLQREQRPSMREVVLMLNGGSNSLRQPPIGLDIPLQTDDSSYSTYISAASLFRSSTTATEYFEDEGNTSISEGEGNVTLTEIESADSNTELQPQGEIQGNEASAARQQREQNNTAVVSIEPFRQQQMRPEFIPSGSGQTVVFKAHTSPEAVYPPFRARVYQRYGSRNLYTF